MKRLCKLISDYLGVLVLAAAMLALVFPSVLQQIPTTVINYLLGVVMFGMTEKRIKEIVSCENANINARMANVTKLLGMEEKLTPTWCRHSYATNLRNAGVSTEYISTMMGHTMTSGSTTTLNYLSRYNMATMVMNNSKLICGKDINQKKAELVEQLMENDLEKLEAMLKLMR